MPTFPNHWAVISGSLEPNETPLETAHRELEEETNLFIILSDTNKQISMLPFRQGLYVDVPYTRRHKDSNTGSSRPISTEPLQSDDHSITSARIQSGDIIRVYPFVVEVPASVYQSLELRGTEHDEMKWITLDELETLVPTVPALAIAFHHATNGKYVQNVPENVKVWANDRINGAATLAKRALQAVKDGGSPSMMKMMRPSMVPITNVLQRLEESSDHKLSAMLTEIQTSLDREANRAVELAVRRISEQVQQYNGESFVIGVFSRSSTLLATLKRVQELHHCVEVVCSQSTPGDEGVLMAKDLERSRCVSDSEMLEIVKNGNIQLVLVGCDCITSEYVVNKIGTSDLVEAAQRKCSAYCCSDRWKIWEDVFPPPLEPIFEQIPISLFDEIFLPPPPCEEAW